MAVLISLLRGVNVGGRRVPMGELRAVYEALGHRDVVTYIQSGNVVSETGGAEPVAAVEDAVRDRFGFDVSVITRTPQEMAAARAANPYRGAADAARVGIVFLEGAPALDPGLEAEAAQFHPEEFVITGREVHVHLPNGFGRANLTHAFFEKRLGVRGTMRNLRTVEKILAIAESRSGDG